jgi:hypothetical protein
VAQPPTNYPPPGPPPYAQPGYPQNPNPQYGDPNSRYAQQDGDYQYAPVDDEQSADVDVGLFYRELSPYGQWIRHPYYGWVWYPRDVGYDWRPYTMGRWVNSDYGWTWVSDEPFGWATYHYGRWSFDPQLGWIWIPGTVWGPAWVSWQSGGGYVGWAPLPPQVGFQAGVGLRIGNFNLTLGFEPTAYTFVDERAFLDDHVDRYCEPPARSVTILRETRNVTDYRYEGDRVVDGGIPVQQIEQVTRRPVARLQVVESSSRRSAVGGNQVQIYRPAQAQLSSAREAQRNNEGLRPESAPRTQPARPAQPGQPAQPGRPAPRSIQVAPAAPNRPTTDFQRVQAQQQQELDRAAQLQQRKLADAQQKDAARPNHGDNSALEARHQEEMKAQQQLQERQQQVAKNRQQIEKQAEDAKNKKGNDKNEQDKKNKKPEPPPPPPPPGR